jgi:NAD(P)-dependent dehydrogenase (short-subunit alcohol dehydrogenase family)
MTEITRYLRLSEEDVARFARFSHDRNPLHTDPDYARRTSFGSPVAHGMLAVLHILQIGCEDSHRGLSRLRVAFRGAILPGLGYTVDWRDAGEEGFNAALRRGDAPKLTLRGNWRPDSTAESTNPAPLSTAPYAEPLDAAPAEGQSVAGAYWGDDTALAALEKAAGASQRLLPASQAHALGLVSYLAGMLIPGRQALLLGAILEFPGRDSRASEEALEFEARVARLDKRFGRVWVELEASRAGTVELKGTVEVGVRPDPVPYRFRQTLPAGEALSSSNAVVTGGTRGLGAHLVGALAERGVNVLATFRSGTAEAQELIAQLADTKGRVHVFQGDLSEDTTTAALLSRADAVSNADLLILNATGPIRRIEVGELEDGELEGIICDAIRITMNPLRALLPRVAAARGTVVFVSSIYVRETPEGFGHYVATKCAIESLLRVLAKERPSVRFMVVRPPRMETDQTAAAFSMERLYDPLDVATWIVRCMQTELTAPGVVQEFDFDVQQAGTKTASS